MRSEHPWKQRKTTLTALAAIFLPFFAGETSAGGRPLAPGDGELIVSAIRTTADERYDANGTKQWKPRYTKYEIAPYAEYGLTEWLTLVGEIAWASEKTDFFGIEFEDRGFTRLKAGGRVALGTWNDAHFSVQPLATLHLAGDTNDPAATGSGDIDTELALIVAQNDTLLGIDIFTVQEVGYRYRDRDRPDEVRADITLGLKPWPGIMLLAKSLNTVATRPTPAGQSFQSGKVALSLVYDITSDCALEAGIERSVFGRNAIVEDGLRLAVWYRF
ncbi:MAG: hypothetical protein Q7V31_11585 [Parvibaculum sp.]|nr:hypothetical protein [Parvibaculum sp.]